jgi:hypothetical protein
MRDVCSRTFAVCFVGIILSQLIPAGVCISLGCRLGQQGVRWVPIQDPAVQYNPDWAVWREGEARGVFVRDEGGQQPYIGQVRQAWAGLG